ncbi:MAG: trans-2-enoyl-CoA reductase family protein [Candidatus Omnitrophica bacterium]|nr:trans-2-enoyl-CoA reductase family protein [Candidatus Omnitrophota bacterium]MDE2008745.1 trans-2-enoyl-CoA reductase family protein [Candidatus Omnitrophota bacterium]MDE2215169.1 trans-2-enoyl-CoA reductase family protein [Candidatus Omnitrophota bacterium]MDE2232172.1 trans-2-enoyl-CoA reductase family protein [Candidatus Omnitrophota bacterium]
MIIKPKIRGFICTTAHPVGCGRHVGEQIEYIRSQAAVANGPKKVLVIGASTGYGLASRIAAAFACGAATIGVFFERPADDRRTATAGWYNSAAFEEAARKAGLYAKSFNGDAFSDEMRRRVCETIKKDLGQVDGVIYSLASPRRTDPKTGEVYKSVLKPKDKPYTNKSIDFESNQVTQVTLEAAQDEEIRQTIKVMGGEDWQLWIDALMKDGLLAKGAATVAYSYIGPDVTTPVYRNGTIGAAKDDLEATAHALDERMKKIGGRALVSVNKALVTQSSSAIPFIPLYFVLLMKVMKAKNVHEDCIHQIYRLFSQRLYNGLPLDKVPTDTQGRVRIDDYEMREDVQVEVGKLWKIVGNENLSQIADVEGYNKDFLKLFGFGLNGVDYDADVPADIPIAGLS